MIRSNIKKVSKSFQKACQGLLGLVISCAAIITLLSLLSSVIFYLGYFHFLGIFTSDINFNISELIDLEVVSIAAAFYCLYLLFSIYIFEKENKKQLPKILTAKKITFFQKTGFILILFLVFLISINKFFGINYDLQMVRQYLLGRLGNLALLGLILIIFSFFIFQFKKLHNIIGFLILVVPLIFSYFTGMYKGEKLALGEIKNNYVITIDKNNRFECFLIKRFNSGDLIFYKNEPMFIDTDNRTIRFRSSIDT